MKNKMVRMVSGAVGLFLALSARAAIVEYDYGATDKDPVSQGWTLNGGGGDGTWGYDAGTGWRTVDGTSASSTFYSKPFSGTDLGSSWELSMTFSPDADYIPPTGASESGFYSADPASRTTGIGVEIGAGGYLFIAILKGDANNNLVVDDLAGHSHVLTTDNSYFNSFKTVTLAYDQGNVSAIYNGTSYSLSAYNVNYANNEVIFGTLGGSVTGSAVWSEVTLVPEPATLALLGAGGLLIGRKRK